jgi:predicted ferric reductase
LSQPKKYKAEVISVKNPVDNVYTIEFRSLSGQFKYRPGQFLHLALDVYDPSYGWPESRCFSMQSSPKQEFIKITFSVKGNFTSRMVRELSNGKIVDLKLPYGELFQQDFFMQDVVFIAGGTGITPFLSLFTDNIFEKYISPKLYFGLRNIKYNIYEDELRNALIINPFFKIETKYEETDGYFQIDQIAKENALNNIYFISGPQSMIRNFKERLHKLGVSLQNIKTDDWF